MSTLEMPLTESGEQLYRDRIVSAINQQVHGTDLKQKLDDLGGLETLINNSATDFWSLPNFYRADSSNVDLKKDPFESQAEYEERLSRVKVEPEKYGIFRIDQTLNLVDKKERYGPSIYTTYDVENQEFVVSIDDSNRLQLGNFSGDYDFSTYEAHNAFGARVTVSRREGTFGKFNIWNNKYSIIEQEYNDELIYHFPIPREEARQNIKRFENYLPDQLRTIK